MTIPCPHWRDINLVGAGQCALGKFKGKPSHGTCRTCLGQTMAPTSSPAVKASLPTLLTPLQQKRVTDHRAICESCEHAKGFTRLTVRCEDCGCAGLSLINGRCPKKKWPD